MIAGIPFRWMSGGFTNSDVYYKLSFGACSAFVVSRFISSAFIFSRLISVESGWGKSSG